jgi:hypothetical protein
VVVEVALEVGEAEVEDADDAVAVDADVVGLDVLVDHAGVVDRGEAAGGVEVGAEDVSPRVFGLPGAQGGALDVLGGDEEGVLALADLVDAQDVGVVDAREQLALLQDALADSRGSGADLGNLSATVPKFGSIAVHTRPIAPSSTRSSRKYLPMTRASWARFGLACLCAANRRMRATRPL